MTGETRYDGLTPGELARRTGAPDVVAFDAIGSTLDAAHALAARGTPGGTLVIADRQTAGRGRGGRAWSSPAGQGIWLTLVERLHDAEAVAVLSIRVGLAGAAALDAFADAPVRLKWPNDLYVGGRKLAGILIEARWRAGAVDWVAVGMGVNVRPPADVPTAAGLRDGAARLDVLAALVPALRRAAARTGPLDDAELEAFAARDIARGARCVAPGAGVVVGLGRAGELLVRDGEAIAAFRAGSLVLAEDP